MTKGHSCTNIEFKLEYGCGVIKDVYTTSHTYFRTQEFGQLVKANLASLAQLLNTTGSLIYLTMSGTGAMEAVVDNCTNKEDKVIVINGGLFGQRFKNLLDFHGVLNDEIKLNWNEQLKYEHLQTLENKGYTMLFVNLHETSTGQLYDIELISNFCKRNNIQLVVDAISTFLADKYDMDKYGIDVTIISSQKGLCLSAGLSFVALSTRIIDKILTNTVSNKYADFKDYLSNITRGQTPYTPAVHIMYELEAMLNYIKSNGGIDSWLKDIEKKCLYFRKQATEIGLCIPSYYNLSNMLTPILCPNNNADIIVNALKEKFQIFVNPCGRVMSNKMFRVSHIGNVTIKDIDNLLEKLAFIVDLQ